MVNAFTIEVQNRDPFGTLNLSTLRIKPNANSSGTMLLSGYTLQIKTASGQINVHKICDENGTGCKDVSSIGGGEGTDGLRFKSINNEKSRLNPDEDDIVWVAEKLVIGGDEATNWINDDEHKLRVKGKTILNGDLIVSGGNITVNTDSGTITVDKICDNSNNCKPVSQLLTGVQASGGGWFGVQWSPVRVNRGEGTSCIQNPDNCYKAVQLVRSGFNVWIGEKTRTAVTSGTKDYKLRVWSGITRINGDLAVTPLGLSNSKNKTEFYVNKNGISMFGSPYFFRGTGDNAVRGLSVNGPIFAGHSGNYIYMYANGTSADDENRSYEILGENELAVGTRGGSFIYFTQRTGTFDNITGGEYPGVIHERNGIINTVGCNPSTPPANTPQGGRGIGGGNISPQTQCTIQNLTGHNYHGVSASELMVDEGDAYNSLMVGVNTDNPQATLDVNGSLRLGSNCLPIGLECNASNAGTMMYLERQASYQGSLVICIANGVIQDANNNYIVNYVWYDIMRGLIGTSLTGDLGFQDNDGSCILPKPNAGVYPEPATEIGSAYEFEPEPLI